MEPSRLADGGSDVDEGHIDKDHAHHPMQQVPSLHQYGVASPVHRSDASLPRRESGSMDALIQSPPSPEDIDLAAPAHSSAYPEGPIHSSSFSAAHTGDQSHGTSSAADGGKKGGEHISAAIAEPCLATRAQGNSSSGLAAAVALQKPRHHQNPRSQRLSLTLPGQDVANRRPGRHVRPLPLFCKAPTRAARGAAMAIPAHKSTTSPSTVPNPLLTVLPWQSVITKSPTLDNPAAPRFPAGGTPVTDTADQQSEDYRGSPIGDERAPSLSAFDAHTMHTPRTATGMDTSATASVDSTAPVDSPSALDRIALPLSDARGDGHSIGSPHDISATAPTETIFVGDTILAADAADGAMPRGDIAVTGAAPPQCLSATSQPKRGDDDRSHPLQSESFASVEDKSLYTLAHSRMPSSSTCTFADTSPHEGLIAAATPLERAFTCPEMQTSLYHGSADRHTPRGSGGAGAERVLMDSFQHRFLDSAQSNPLSPNTLRMSVSASAAAAVAAIGVTRSTPLLCPLRAEEQRHHRITVATKAEEETLLRQSISAGDAAAAAAAIDSTSQSAFLTRSFTAPSHVASTTSVTVPDGWGASSVAGRSRSLVSQHTDTLIDTPGASVAVNAAGGAAVVSKGNRCGSISHCMNNSSLFLGGSFATAVGASSMRSSLPAPVCMQQNKSALVAELKLRRHRLQKSLGVLQREVTARNIFALVRASNASQLQHLLQVGLCSVNDRDYNGCTPLHVAAGEGNHTIVCVLLSFGADVVAVDHSGRTPLDCAAANRHSGVAHCLLTVIRNKHLSDDGPLASMRGDGPNTNEGSSTTEAHTSQSDSPAWSAAPLLLSAADAPASSSTLCTTGRTTQNSTPAQQHRALPGSSPTLLLPIHRQHQPQPWASSSSVTSTPSPSMPENSIPTPRLDAAGGHPTDADNWSGTDTPPHVAKRPVEVAPAGAAADDSAAAGSAPPSATPKALSSLTSENIRGLAARWVLPQSTVQQSFTPQHGSDSAGKLTGTHNSLVRHESLMSLSASRRRHNSALHGSSPQRPVFLSSLDSTAAAHSRGLIAAESNGSSITTAPLPSGGGGDDDEDPDRRPVVSAPPYLAGGMEESSSYEALHATAQRPPSRANTDECRIPTATAPGTMAKWSTDGQLLVDPQGHPHHLQSESCASLPGGFASASTSSTWCVTPGRIPAEKDVRHNRKDRGIFKETGSFPGEMPTQLSERPGGAAATGASTAAVLTSETPVATASSVSPQQRPMLLRPPRHPQNRSSATDLQSFPLDAEKDAPPTRMLRPFVSLSPDNQDRLDGEQGSDAAFTSMTLTTETSAATQVNARVAPGAPKSSDDLSGSMAASGAGSLRDIGQQSLEEHHHQLRMTAGGMRVPPRQSTLKSNSERYAAPLPASRASSEPTTTEMLGMPSASGSGGRSTAATDKHDDVAQFISHPTAETSAMADAPRSLWSTGADSDAVAPTHQILATHDPLNKSEAASPTGERWATAENSTLETIQGELDNQFVLDHSSYTTVSDTVSIIVCMVGLPGRGKSFISKRLVRYMNWKGVPCKVFNAGNYRRHLLGVEETACADFFDPNNPQGAQLRERMAELACEDLLKFIASYSIAVGILDATNTTRKRRAWLLDYFHREAQRYGLPYRLLFIESVCTDDAIVTENILRSKCDNEDFKNVKDVDTVIAEFRTRILHYEKVYETLEPEERIPYIKIINVKHHVILHRVPNGLGSRIAFFLLNLHPIAFPIYVALPGETVGDRRRVYGGEERLTARGEAYAMALRNFIQDRYVPHMVVLHATNSCVLSTLAPLMDGAMEEEGTNLAPMIGHVNGHGVSGSRAFPHKAAMQEPQHQSTAAKSSEAVQSPLRRLHQDNPPTSAEGGSSREGGDHAGAPWNVQPHGAGDGDGGATGADALPCSGAMEALIQVENSSDEEEVSDEVFCAVPGLDNINFGRFSGHTTAWVNNKYPRLSALLYDMDDGDAVGDATDVKADAPAVQHHPNESFEAQGSAGSTASPKVSGPAKTVHCSPAPLPPPMHYATREEAIAHFQRALGDVDPRLAYGIPLPNGESFRQVNVRLEPALMAIMRTQSPVFVVAPAVPAQGVLAFFMDLIPELSPTIRIPKGCVVEIGVKNGITVHPLLPDSLPENMTRSPLMVLPAIQEAIREVATTTFLEKKAEAHVC